MEMLSPGPTFLMLSRNFACRQGEPNTKILNKTHLFVLTSFAFQCFWQFIPLIVS
jgi:hypothetical protein